VAVEAARVERNPNRPLDDELTDVERRSIGLDRFEPARYLARLRTLDRRSVEGANPVLEDDSLTLR
jgi:hypothetical protein